MMLSIVIPVYNEKSLIVEVIRNVLSVNYPAPENNWRNEDEGLWC